MDDQLKDMKLDDSLQEVMDDQKGETQVTVKDGNGDLNKPEAEASARIEKSDTPDNSEAGKSAGDKSSVGSTPTMNALINSSIHHESVLPRSQVRSMQDRELSLMLKTRGRALSQALMTIAGTKQRSGRLWLTCAITLILIALLVIQVYYRHREINLGYELSSAISQREVLLEENRKLRIELRVLSRRERLEPLAGKQLGMSTIQPEQVLIVKEKHRLKREPEPGKRQDGLDNVKRIGVK